MFKKANSAKPHGTFPNYETSVKPVTKIVLVSAGLALAGCNLPSPQTGIQRVGSLQSFQASDRHPIEVAKGDVKLEVEIPRFAPGLSPRQVAEVDAFIADYKSMGESEITISVPSGGRNEGAAMGALSKLRKRVRASGINDKSIRYTPYYVRRKTSAAPIIISYQRYYANASPCGDWPDNIAHEPTNKSYEAFGCASQNNLAAMVANPRDLLQPRVMTGIDNGRRAAALDKWRKGEVTGAEKSKEESGNSSTVKE